METGIRSFAGDRVLRYHFQERLDTLVLGGFPTFT